MNKKLLALLALFIVVASVSAVSAFDLGDIFGSNEKNETISVGGVDFNIPGGFKEVSDKNATAQFDALKKEGYNVTTKFFEKGSDGFGICVANLTGTSGLPDDYFSENATTVKDINGSMIYTGDVYLFKYQKNNDLVMVSAEDKDLISEVLIA